MSITGIKSYSTANIQGENSSNETATINARLTVDELEIGAIQQTITGQSYNSGTDTTTIDNNVTINGTLTTNPLLASQTYVNNKISALVASAPTTLDTLNELATALGNDVNFSTTVINSLATKASLSASQTISGINTMSNTSNTYFGNGANLTGVITTLPTNLMKTDVSQTITGLNSFTNNTSFTDGGTNISSIDQLAQQFNISNTNYNNTITTITGLIPSVNLSCIIRTDAVSAPLINGRVSGVNINTNSTNNLYINSVTTSSITAQSNFPTYPLTQIYITAGSANIGTCFTNSIGTSFALGTYITASLGAGYFQLNQPTLVSVAKANFTSMYILLNKACVASANGNIYLDYNPCINLQIPISAGVPRNMITIDNTNGITMGSAVNCSSVPSIGSHLVNKTYVDSVIASNTVTTNTNQTITAVKTFNNTLLIQADTNNAVLRISADTTTGKNYIQSGVTNTAGSATDIIFGSIFNSTSYATFNSPGIFLQAGQGSCLYGRNDGFTFDVPSTLGATNGLYPIGYSWEILGALSTPVSGANYAGTVASIPLTLGVWAISGYVVINKGTGAYVATSRVEVLWETVAGIRIYPASSGLRFPLITSNTTAQLVIPLGTINVVVTSYGVTQTITRSIIMTVGTATWQVSFTGVKIA